MAELDAQPVSIQITFSLPFPLTYKGAYEVRFGELFVSVVLNHVKQESFDQRMGVDQGDFDLLSDRSGVASYTSVQIKSDWASFKTLCESYSCGSSEEFAQLVTNKVIDSYRHATRTPWVRRVKTEELYQLDCRKVLSNGQTMGEATIVSAASGITLPREIVKGSQDFTNRLTSDTPPPIWDTLWLDSEDAMERGDVRSAIISAHSAIETLANATVLSWAREQRLSVDQAACRLGRDDSERGSLRSNLSIDELVSFLNDTRKVEIALLDICKADQSLGFDLYRRFERLAADRNKTLHAGAIVKERYAQDHIEAIRAIRQHLVTGENVERIQRHQEPVSAVKTLTELLGREFNPELQRLLVHLESIGTVIVIWSMRRYPISLHKKDSVVALERSGNRLDIYIRSRRGRVDDDAEKELTRMLIQQVLLQAGWPCAVVNEPVSTGKPTPSMNWEGYRVIARAVTNAVHGVAEINETLARLDFNVQEELEARSNCLKRRVTSSTFTLPMSREVNYHLLLIQMSYFELSGVERSWCLPPTLEREATRVTQKLRGLIERCTDLGWDSSRIAATLMLTMLSELGLIDHIGVSEGPNRRIRTRFVDEELSILNGLKQHQTKR